MKRRKKEWFDDDSFWRDLYPYLFSSERFDEARQEVRNVLKLVKARGKAVLDLCCGPGRFSVALAERGYAVTGVDRTKFLLEKARARARAAKVKIEWVHSDMRDFIRPDSFDLALSMFTSFGYFDKKEEDDVVLDNIYAGLHAGGACLIDVMGKERLAQIFTPTSCDVLPDGTRLVQHREVFDGWSRIRNEWTLIRSGRAKTFQFHHSVYSGQELKGLLERAGFREVKLYGNLEGDEYDLKAQRLVAVGRKPKAPGRRKRK